MGIFLRQLSLLLLARIAGRLFMDALRIAGHLYVGVLSSVGERVEYARNVWCRVEYARLRLFTGGGPA